MSYTIFLSFTLFSKYFFNTLFFRYNLSSTCVQGIETPKEKHEGKKGTRDQKTVFASFEFCFFVVRRQWTGLLPGPIWQRCIRSLCATEKGRGRGGSGTPKGALSVCVGIIKNILSAFCVKFADFFSLSVAWLWLCCFSLVVFAVRRGIGGETAAIFGACFNDSWSSFVNFWSTLLGGPWKTTC